MSLNSFLSLKQNVHQLQSRACRLKLDPSKPKLTDEEKSTLLANIQLLRDAIVLFTATGAARGVSGHTGTYLGAYNQLG